MLNIEGSVLVPYCEFISRFNVIRNPASAQLRNGRLIAGQMSCSRATPSQRVARRDIAPPTILRRVDFVVGDARSIRQTTKFVCEVCWSSTHHQSRRDHLERTRVGRTTGIPREGSR